MINPNPETIEGILNSSSQLKVPKYQREYKWGVSEAGEFWEDIESYLDVDEGNLFLGNLIFDISEKDKKTILIIDGQQRLTTILILLVACRELAKRINASKIANKIQEKISFEDSTTGEFLGSRLWASESIKKVFDHISNSDWDGIFPDKISGKPVKRQSNRIKPIYNYFSANIETYDHNALSKLLSTLYESYIVRIEIEDEIEAFKIFERTNARGLDLEASDLLKNYLFSTIGDSAEESWYRIIDFSEGTILRMLKYFYVSKNGHVQKSHLYQKLKVYGKHISAEILILELEEFASFYKAIRSADSPTMKSYLRQIGLLAVVADQEKFDDIFNAIEGLRLFKVTQIYPLISAAINCFIRSGQGETKADSKKLVKFFRYLENYHFINNAICERIGNEIERLYAEYSKQFANSDNFDEIIAHFYVALGQQKAVKEEFVSRFVDITYQASSIPLISYIFDRINNYDVAAGHRIKIFNPDEKTLRKNHNIEHFSPQNPPADANLPALSGDEVNNIGNLLCISYRTNSKLGNLTPQEKFKKLSGNLLKDIQNLHYVREFIIEYKDNFGHWDKNVINNRAEKIANLSYDRVWNI